MSGVIFWDLVYKVTENDLQKKEDVLTLLIHFLLLKTGHKCIGLGEEKNISKNESGEEVLPKGWNCSNNYSIRYVKNGVLYILKGLPVENNIVYNLLRVDTLAVTNVAFSVDDTVECIRGPLEAIFKNKSSEVIDKVCQELLNSGGNKEVTTQTAAAAAATERNPRNVEPSPLVLPGPAALPQPYWTDPEHDPLRVGRTDLDPFGRGGGMIFDPFGPRGPGPDAGAGIPGGLPRGAVPPGARFDPFGPPGAGQPPRPRHPPPDSDNFGLWFM